MNVKLVVLFLFAYTLGYSQNFAIIENKGENAKYFNYNNPNSLVSMLLQNRDKIIDIGLEEINFSGVSTINEYSLHPLDNMSSFSGIGRVWEILTPNLDTLILVRNSNSESFEDWFERLTTIGTEPTYNPLMYEELLRIPRDLLRRQYDQTKENRAIRKSPVSGYYDLDQIDKIIIDSTNIYFAKKSPYENKHFICLKLNLNFLSNLQRLDYLPEELTKKITNKIREYQIKKREEEPNWSDYPQFSIDEYDANKGDFFQALEDKSLKSYLASSAIKKSFSQGFWKVLSSDEDTIVLIKDNNTESFENWFNRLTTEGIAPNYNPSHYVELINLTDEEKLALSKQYLEATAGNPIKRPPLEAVYWIDYPNPAVYLKRSFEKDSLGKFNTIFSQLLFTERLEKIEGVGKKPQVLMVFGSEYTPISSDLLKIIMPEILNFNQVKEFEWQRLINKKQGKKISNQDLQKIIHCYRIDEFGIYF